MFAGREWSVDRTLRFLGPTEERDFVAAFFENLDGPVTAKALLISAPRCPDGALVPWRAGVEPIVGRHRDLGVVGMA